MESPTLAQELWELNQQIGKTVQIQGSIYKIRKMSHFSFVLLRAGGTIVQCVYSEEQSRFPLEQLEEESCVRLTAHVKEEPRSKSGFELLLLDAEILSRPEARCPVVINNRSVDTPLETLLNYRPITLRNQKEAAILPDPQEALAGRHAGVFKGLSLHGNPYAQTGIRGSGRRRRCLPAQLF